MTIILNRYQEYKKSLTSEDIVAIDNVGGEQIFDKHISNIERKLNEALEIVKGKFEYSFIAGFTDYDNTRSDFFRFSKESSISYNISTTQITNFIDTVFFNINSDDYEPNNKVFNVCIELDLKKKVHIASCYPEEFVSGTDLEKIYDDKILANITIEFLNDFRLKTKGVFQKFYSEDFLYNINLFYRFVIINDLHRDLKNEIINLNNVKDFIELYNLTHDINTDLENKELKSLRKKIDKKNTI